MKLYQNRNWLYQKYITEELSTPKIAGICKCGRSTVNTWLRRYGIKIRTLSEAQQGKLAPWWGKAPSKKTRKKLSEAQTRYRAQFLEPKSYHDREWLYQKYVVEKLSSFKIAKLCDDYGERIWYWIDKFKLDKRNKSEAVKEYHRQNPEARYANWNNPAYIKKFVEGCQRKPSNPERTFDEMTPESIRYIGDGRWWKVFKNGKHKNPDFKITGQNKVIEIFGDYWHRNDDPQELIDLYKQIGFDCLVIWEREIKNDPSFVIEKVRSFINE